MTTLVNRVQAKEAHPEQDNRAEQGMERKENRTGPTSLRPNLFSTQSLDRETIVHL